jgi:hypothetical protein
VLFLPATYLVHGFKKAILDEPPAGPGKLLVVLVSLIVWFLLTLFLSSQLFRWEPEAKIGRKAKLYVAATVIPFILLGIWEAKNGRVIDEEKIIIQKLDDSDKAKEKTEQQSQPDAQNPQRTAPENH